MKMTHGKKENFSKTDDKEKYVLQLYVNGSKPSSARAIKNCIKLCEEYLDEAYKLQVIDLHEHPLLAIQKDIIATPTLTIQKFPGPLQKLIGDLSEIDHALLAFNLKKL
jgi:circadian clock protein KaiB